MSTSYHPVNNMCWWASLAWLTLAKPESLFCQPTINKKEIRGIPLVSMCREGNGHTEDKCNKYAFVYICWEHHSWNFLKDSKIFNLPGFEQVRTNPILGTQNDKCHNDKKEIYVFIMAVLCPVLPTKFDRRPSLRDNDLHWHNMCKRYVSPGWQFMHTKNNRQLARLPPNSQAHLYLYQNGTPVWRWQLQSPEGPFLHTKGIPNVSGS